MKKILQSILLILCILLSVQTFAENVGAVNAVYSSPAAFKPDQTVTFYFDLTGTGLVGMTNLHLYSWTPKEIEPWGSPTPNTLLTKDATNDALYTLTCVPTTLWGITADLFGYKIEGLIKTEDGTKQTDDFKEANGNAFELFDYHALNAGIAVVWPPAFTYGKPISVMVNLATAWSGDGSTQGQLIGQNVFIWLGANSWSPSSQYNVLGDVNAKCNAVPNETNLSQYDFWPKNVFPLPEIVIKELDFIFNNGSWNLTARDVAGFDFKIKPQTGSVSSGAFTPFPTKVTDLDLININYNPKLDTIGSGLPQGILTGSDRVFIYMEFETATGNLIPVAIGDLTKTSRLQMQNLADGTFEFHFILRNLFTENELPTGVEVKKIFFKFVNYDGLVSPFGNMDPKLYKIDKILKAD